MCCGQTREHSPQSVQRPATWNARMMWNMFSSKLVAVCLLPQCPKSWLSNTHFHAGARGTDVAAGVAADAAGKLAPPERKPLVGGHGFRALPPRQSGQIPSSSPCSPSSSSYVATSFLALAAQAAFQAAHRRLFTVFSPVERVNAQHIAVSSATAVTPLHARGADFVDVAALPRHAHAHNVDVVTARCDAPSRAD